MKAKDLRERSTQDLGELRAQLEKELFSYRMKKTTKIATVGTTPGSSRTRACSAKRDAIWRGFSSS